jgi:cbb3-type cytochrome oxidase subunit 3
MEFIVAANIPIGQHRLPLTYDGFYFNGGELDEATAFEPINGGDGVVVDPDADALTVVFAIEVVDSAISCHVTGIVGGNAGDKANLISETITVTIANDEMYRFIDITVRANFTNTPWYNPIIGMNGDQRIWANQANPSMLYPGWDPAAGIDPTHLVVSFTVDTNPNMTPDTYPFQLEITAVIEQTLEVVTMTVGWQQGATIYYAGYGPDIYITAFTDEDIVPGQEFQLVLNLTNQGDETVRDVDVMIWTDGTYEYPWLLEQQFKAQFDWSGVFEDWGSGEAGQVTWEGEFPEDMFYTVEDLDVDNIREIVEINLYMDGVYSQPAARIEVIHIIDLAPGATTQVTFDMLTDKDMVNGKPYDFPVMIDGVRPNGGAYEQNRWITVMSSIPGESYNPVELNWFDAGLKALALFLFFIIVLAILLFVYNMFKGEPYDEDDEDFDFEDEESFESAPAEEKKEGLVEP